jgi:hypothetical protein
MSENRADPVPTHPNVWQAILGALFAAVAPVVVKAVVEALADVQKRIAPWDGQDRRAPPPPAAGGTP